MSAKKCKLFPKGRIKIEPLEMVKENIFLMNGLDEDNDVYTLAKILAYTDTLPENAFSDEEDIKIFDSFRKTKGRKKVFVDLVDVLEPFQRNGVGSTAMIKFEELMKEKGVEAICLKAYPLIHYKYGLITDTKNKNVKTEKKGIHEFYKGLGYEYARKGTDYMFKYI